MRHAPRPVHQRIQILPRSVVREAATRALTARLRVTDCGFFPTAFGHIQLRPSGSPTVIVMICTEGRGWLDVDGHRHTVEPGQVVVIPPGVPHSYGADDHHPWTIWWAHAAGDDSTALVDALDLTPATVVFPVIDTIRLASLVDEALEFMEQVASPSSLAGAASAIWHLLALLPSQRDVAGGRADPIDAVIHLLKTDFAAQSSIADLARSASLSPSYFESLFRERTGLTVLEYRTDLRMNKARVLLDSTDLPVAAIAHQVGYADALYFSRRFKQIHSVSPTEYRSAAKG